MSRAAGLLCLQLSLGQAGDCVMLLRGYGTVRMAGVRHGREGWLGKISPGNWSSAMR